MLIIKLFIHLKNKIMNKSLKIAAIALIIFALVTNLHSALFSYYGIKTNNLDGAVWATALTTTNPTSTSGGTSTSGAFWNLPVKSTVHCGVMYFSGSSTNNGGASVSYTTNVSGTVSANVSYSTSFSGSYTGSVAAHDATMIQCTGPSAVTFCSGTTALEACE